MSVRAKFRLDRIEITMQSRDKWDEQGKPVKGEDGRSVYEKEECRTLVFFPVMPSSVAYDGKGSTENTRFWRASPSGEIKLGIVNPEAWRYFEMGEEYYFDISPSLSSQSI